MSVRWVTVTGWMCWSMFVACLVLGLSLSWREVLIIAVALGLVAVVGLSILRRRGTLVVTFASSVVRVLPGTRATLGVTLANPGRFSTSATDVDIPVGSDLVTRRTARLPGGGAFETVLEVDAPRRMVIPIGPVSIVRRDPFGLYRRSITLHGTAKVVVHPTTATLPPLSAGFVRDLEGEATRDLTDSDLSFHALREYVAGDDRRHIHWKSSAKTGRFMIRQYEQTRRSRMLIVLDTRRGAYVDDAEFELAVSAAASLGVRALRDSRDVTFAVSHASLQHQVQRPRSSALQVRETVARLSSVSPPRLLDDVASVTRSEASLPIAALTPYAAQLATDVSVVFVVTGSTPQVSDIEQASLPFGAGVEVITLRCSVEGVPSLRTSGRLSVGTLGRLDDLTKLMTRHRVGA
ncbi:MAG: DUF58 domain-containing protein [Actinobacteria bacterium]|uniref:Unannotated protein n=1 Tax=freshwater metagenome TaxID=449393 RepID=A0A6J7F4Q6_9ZZZZ|nr:DUF58 domain-containing protein [Actinomycetota bacterium]